MDLLYILRKKKYVRKGANTARLSIIIDPLKLILSLRDLLFRAIILSEKAIIASKKPSMADLMNVFQKSFFLRFYQAVLTTLNLIKILWVIEPTIVTKTMKTIRTTGNSKFSVRFGEE